MTKVFVVRYEYHNWDVRFLAVGAENRSAALEIARNYLGDDLENVVHLFLSSPVPVDLKDGDVIEFRGQGYGEEDLRPK